MFPSLCIGDNHETVLEYNLIYNLILVHYVAKSLKNLPLEDQNLPLTIMNRNTSCTTQQVGKRVVEDDSEDSILEHR